MVVPTTNEVPKFPVVLDCNVPVVVAYCTCKLPVVVLVVTNKFAALAIPAIVALFAIYKPKPVAFEVTFPNAVIGPPVKILFDVFVD